jgi:hypothetical protein
MDILDVKAMSQRFRDRANAVKDRTMPPIAGAERLAFIAQANADYQDFAMIADCEILLKDGVLVLTLDLRPPPKKEKATQAAMENIASALPTDGAKIKMSQLDAGSDLQDLVKDSKRFLTVVREIKPIDVTLCPGFSLTHGYLA